MDSKTVTDILNKNLECMKKYRPILYGEVKKYLDKQHQDLDFFKYIETKDRSGTIEIVRKQNRIRLNSIYSPKKEAEKW